MKNENARRPKLGKWKKRNPHKNCGISHLPTSVPSRKFEIKFKLTEENNLKEEQMRKMKKLMTRFFLHKNNYLLNYGIGS